MGVRALYCKTIGYDLNMNNIISVKSTNSNVNTTTIHSAWWVIENNWQCNQGTSTDWVRKRHAKPPPCLPPGMRGFASVSYPAQLPASCALLSFNLQLSPLAIPSPATAPYSCFDWRVGICKDSNRTSKWFVTVYVWYSVLFMSAFLSWLWRIMLWYSVLSYPWFCAFLYWSTRRDNTFRLAYAANRKRFIEEGFFAIVE